MISKELLSEVMGDEWTPRVCEGFEVEGNTLTTHYDCGNFDNKGRPTRVGMEINIYELAHKCKEWAFRQGFIISEINYLFTLDYKFPDFRACVWCILDNHKVLKTQNPETPCMYFDEPTYYEAIFKACEWILENRSE